MAQEIAPAAFERELGKFRVVRRADFTGESLRRLSPEEARKWRVEQAEARDKEERAAAKKEAQRRTRGADGAQSGGFYGRLAAELEAAGYDNVQEVLKEFKKVSCLCRPAAARGPLTPRRSPACYADLRGASVRLQPRRVGTGAGGHRGALSALSLARRPAAPRIACAAAAERRARELGAPRVPRAAAVCSSSSV